MTRLRLVLYGICLVGALGSDVGHARAEPALEAPRVTENPAARKALQKAGRAFAARRWEEAEVTFKAMLAAPDAAGMTAAQRAELLGYLGLCELEQGKHREAAEHLGQSLEQDAALHEALVRRFTRAFNKAVEHVGRIYVAASPPDAEILVDGEPIGTGAAAHELFVEPGTYTLRARLSGYGEVSQRVEVAAGRTVRAALQLARAADAPAGAHVDLGRVPRSAAAPGVPRAPTPSRAARSVRHPRAHPGHDGGCGRRGDRRVLFRGPLVLAVEPCVDRAPSRPGDDGAAGRYGGDRGVVKRLAVAAWRA